MSDAEKDRWIQELRDALRPFVDPSVTPTAEDVERAAAVYVATE